MSIVSPGCTSAGRCASVLSQPGSEIDVTVRSARPSLPMVSTPGPVVPIATRSGTTMRGWGGALARATVHTHVVARAVVVQKRVRITGVDTRRGDRQHEIPVGGVGEERVGIDVPLAREDVRPEDVSSTTPSSRPLCS